MPLYLLTTRLSAYFLAYSLLFHLSECGMKMVSPGGCFAEVGVAFYPAASSIMCSSMCLHFQGLAYRFQDGMCELRGVGLQNTEGFFETSQVYEPLFLKDVSRGKPTFSSQPYASKFHSSKAVDKDDDTVFSNADDIPQPFWVIDLEGQHEIHTVDILPLYHATGRFNDIGVFVGTHLPYDDIYTVWAMLGHYQGPYKKEEGRIQFTCRSLISGRYVAVQRVSSTSQKLELADVKVYVPKP